MSWIFDHVGLIIFFAIAYGLWRKVRKFLREVTEETERRVKGHSHPATSSDPEAARRVRQVQEEIRRKIAERRGNDQRAQTVSSSTNVPPVLSPAEAPASDAFGGTVRRVMAELERRIEAAAPAKTPEPPRRDAQLERQEQLAAEMRRLEVARTLAARRAAQTAAGLKTQSESAGGMRTISRGHLLEELRDPRSLRRAFVLREVLGPPVGLR